MSARAKIGLVVAVVVGFVGIAVLASGSLLGLVILVLLFAALAVIASRGGAEADDEPPEANRQAERDDRPDAESGEREERAGAGSGGA